MQKRIKYVKKCKNAKNILQFVSLSKPMIGFKGRTFNVNQFLFNLIFAIMKKF